MRLRTAWVVVRERMRKRPAAVPADKKKQKVRGLSAMPTPYVLAFGLPMLAEHSRRLLLRATQFIERAAKVNPTLSWEQDDDARRAVKQFGTASLMYLVTALALWDSMRKKQYRQARFGTHVRAVTLHNGQRVIRTEWTGERDDPARVKMGQARSWHLPAGAIDLEVWDAYLSLVRAPRLCMRGVPAEEAIAPNGKYALFVTDETTDDESACFSDTQISQILFGGGMLWMARRVFGVSELPDTVEDLDRHRWKGVFAIHFVRDLKATYLGVVMGEWGAAEEHTLDEERTLRKHYVQSIYGATFEAAGWNVRAFDQWSRRALLGSDRVAADALCHPELRALLPAEAQRTLQAWRRVDREAARRARTTVGGVSGGRTRRRRPGQKPPVTDAP